MAVYVDDARIPAKVRKLERCWSHLMADTPEELHAFGAQLGLKRSWFQDHKPFWHYDVTEGMRLRTLALGAQPVTSREAVDLPHWQRQRERELPAAEQAELGALLTECLDIIASAERETATGRRLLITGSRTWTDETVIRRELDARFAAGTILVSGSCPDGADAICERVWTELGGQVEQHPADWERDGKAAGFIRNARMVQVGADESIAFIRDGSKGATHCANLAAQAGIPVARHEMPEAAASEPETLTGLQQADQWAAEARAHREAGRLAQAAAYNHACRQVDPSWAPLWRSRAERLLEAASLQSLAVQNAVRLAVAGITAADPGLRQLAEHNPGVQGREAGQ